MALKSGKLVQRTREPTQDEKIERLVWLLSHAGVVEFGDIKVVMTYINEPVSEFDTAPVA